MDALNFNVGGYTLSGGSITLSSAASTSITVPNGTATINSTLIGGNLQLLGTGTLVLGGTNTYSGTTSIASGTLQVGNAALQNSTLALTANNSLTFSAGLGRRMSRLSGTGNVALQDTAAGAVNLTVGGNNASTTYTGLLSGAGGLGKSGTGTLTVVLAQSYSGGTTISGGGTLRVLGVPTSNPVASGLLYQLDASASNNYSTSSGTFTWNDSSTSGNSFTGTAGPTLSTTLYHGLNALSFATSHSLKLSTATTPETVFMAENVTSHAANYAGIWGNGSQDIGIREDVSSSSVWRNGPGSNANNGDYTWYAGGQMSINGVAYPANAPAGGMQVMEASATGYGPFPTTVLNGYSSANRPMGVDIGEVLAFSTTLTTVQQEQVEEYLMYKWMGTTLAGVPNSNALPTTTNVVISGGSTLDLSALATQTIASLSATDGLNNQVLLGGSIDHRRHGQHDLWRRDQRQRQPGPTGQRVAPADRFQFVYRRYDSQ